MRLLYGGTFDPVHEGHLAIARAAGQALGGVVDLLPAADPPHRAPPGASALQRATMLELAIGCERGLRVDRRELQREGRSYTIDTLEQVRAEIGPDEPLVWILGVDSLLQLASWHHWQRLFEFAHLLGVERPGTRLEPEWLRENAPEVAAELAPRWSLPAQLAATPAGRYAPLPMVPLREESATEVRRRIAVGQDWSALVPALVARYVREQGLYGPG